LAEITAFGEALKRARSARGLALEAAASATRISRQYLDALEKGELEALPSGPFGRSYLRSYAEFLGIDPEPVLESYRSTESARGLGTAQSGEKAVRDLAALLEKRSRQSRSSLGPVLFALVTGSALLLVVWLRWEPAAEPQSRVEVKEAPQAAEVVEPEEVLAEEPAVEPPPPARAAPAREISVTDSAVGTQIVNHRLVDRADRFSEGEQVAFWTRVLAAKPGEVIHHYWLHEGRPVMRTDLPIRATHWRTFSRYTLPDGSSGSWVVEARDGEGRVLARAEFLCVESGG
jgi:transcriptional regulator with XRE-family HTH domain